MKFARWFFLGRDQISPGGHWLQVLLVVNSYVLSCLFIPSTPIMPNTPSFSTLYLITGTSRGIGQALVRQLISQPQNLVVGFSRTASPEVEKHPNWLFRQTNLDAPTQSLDIFIKTLHQLLGQEWSRIVFIQNAGKLEPIGNAGTLFPEAIRSNLTVNLVSPILLADAFVSATRELAIQKQLLFISTGAARKGSPGWGCYAAAKAGIDRFASCMEAEQAKSVHPIRTSALAPGVVDTDMQAFIRDQSPEVFPGVDRFISLKNEGRLWSTDETATKIIRCLESTDFGKEAITDLRVLYPD